MIRPYRETDEPQIAALLTAAWPTDPVLVEISSLHGPDLDEGELQRRTFVAEEEGTIAGFASVVATRRHPTFSFFTVVVAPERRRRGIATRLLAELRRSYDARPQLARLRDTDAAGLAFLEANGFTLRMRSREVTVDPADAAVAGWIADQPAIELERPADREEVARAHEQAYGRVHASWAPTPARPLEESLRVFCGEGWLADSAALARDGADVSGVASLYGPPFVFAGAGLFMIADTISADPRALRSLVAAQLGWARGRGTFVAFEADEANVELWQLMHELPVLRERELLLLST